MKKFFYALGAFIAISIWLQISSCKKENNSAGQYSIPANLQKISSGYASGAATKVEIYAAGSLFVGYNKLYIALYDSVTNQPITQAQVSLSILNTAGDVSQSGPIENPSGTSADSGLFNAAVVFTIPSGSGAWTLTAQITNLLNQKSGGFVSPVTVVQASPAKAYSTITMNDGSSLFVSIVQPVDPQIGSNPFEMTIHKQISATNFTQDSDYTVQINPIMPSMAGMNSPNNINPVVTSNGHYSGKVNFTMGGSWQVNVRLMHNGALADTSHYFNINL